MGYATSDLAKVTAGTVTFSGTGNKTATFTGANNAIAQLNSAGNVLSAFGTGSILIIPSESWIGYLDTVDSPSQSTMIMGPSAAWTNKTYILLAPAAIEAIVSGKIIQMADKGSAEYPFPEFVWDDKTNGRLRVVHDAGLIKFFVGLTRPIDSAETATNLAFSIDPATGEVSFTGSTFDYVGRTGNQYMPTATLTIGHNARVPVGPANATNPILQGHAAGPASQAFYRWSADAGGPAYEFFKSRGASIGTRGAVQSGDTLGTIIWRGDDGTNSPAGALIRAVIDGTPGAGDQPTRLEFATTPDGASAPVVCFTLGNSGLATLTDRLVISGANTTRFMIGHGTPIPIGATSAQVVNAQIHGTDAGSAQIGVYRWSNDIGAPGFSVIKSRGASPGTHAIVQSGDRLGALSFAGDDGVNYPFAAQLLCTVDGTPSAGFMPGKLALWTSNGSAQIERAYIDSTGLFTMLGGLVVATFVRPGTYTIGTLPSASAVGAGAMARASDGASNKQIVFSDGSIWRYMDGTAV